jgi:effector-binding domain-containing protein
MSLREAGIVHKKYDDTIVATVRFNLKERKELHGVFDKLARHIPAEHIAGPAFCIFRFVSEVEEGFDVEAGFPVTRPITLDGVDTWTLPAMEVLALVHEGPVDQLSESYGKLYGYTGEHALISDEFGREFYLDGNNPTGERFELHFVIHDWNRLLSDNLTRVLGEEGRREVVQGSGALTLESTLEERFAWTKGAMERLGGLASEAQTYDVVSSCAHVFPKDLLPQLRTVYDEARAGTDDPLEAVDAVIEFMADRPVWGPRSRREGRLVYAAKNPRDRAGYEAAETEAERRSAYCFCPTVRNCLDQGMPITFCYCGAGWYRQRWEAALGRPVRVEVVKSVLKGDDLCQFAIHLPDDL